MPVELDLEPLPVAQLRSRPLVHEVLDALAAIDSLAEVDLQLDAAGPDEPAVVETKQAKRGLRGSCFYRLRLRPNPAKPAIARRWVSTARSQTMSFQSSASW